MHFVVIFGLLVSGRRESNPLHSPWQGDILPVNYARIMCIVYHKFVYLFKCVLYWNGYASEEEV